LTSIIRSHSRTGGVDDRAEQHHAGVVDHDVEPPELLGGVLDRGPRLLALGDVRLDREAADLGDERVQAVLAARNKRHCCPVCRERPRRRRPDPAARARDQRDRARQCCAHTAGVYRARSGCAGSA
jgi:hypothetical protein